MSSQRKDRGCCGFAAYVTYRFVCIIVTVLVISAVSVTVFTLVTGRTPQGGWTWPFVGDESSSGVDYTQVIPWSNNGNGLQLNVLNALEPNWYVHFDQAIQEWDSGVPDALDLSTRVVPHEVDCKPRTGQLKVCNGDYGETDWKGINELLVSEADNSIVWSVAKLNEYYLRDERFARRQYTMCHEIGHGFGLPHTDENFFNRNLGNCMDYTNRPETNQSPDESTYQLLADVYGEIPSDVGGASSSLRGGNRRRRAQEEESEGDEGEELMPEWLLSAWNEAAERLEQTASQYERLLQDGEDTAEDVHEAVLGGGYKLVLHKLRADPHQQ